MPLNASFRRLASAGLAVLVLASSLTCMTVACRVICAAEATTRAVEPAGLPPCHGAATADGSSAPAPAPGDCGSGSVCCSTWLHDRDVYRMPAPILVRGLQDGDVPALLAVEMAVAGPLPGAVVLGTDPPDPHLALLATPRASRAPPAA